MFARDYSVIITPHSGGPVRSFFVSRWVIRSFSAFFAVLIICVGLVVYSTVLNNRVLNEAVFPAYSSNAALAEENSRLASELKRRDTEIDGLMFEVEKEREEYAAALARLYASVKRLNKFYTDLKIMAGFKLTAEEAKKLSAAPGDEKLGSGGGSIDRYEYIQSMLLFSDEDFIREAMKRESALAKECARCEKEFLVLKAMLEKKKSLLSDMPDLAPVRGTITSYFGARRSNGVHGGLDIAVAAGTPVIAPADGVAMKAGPSPLYGNVVFLDHGEGVTSRYAHLSDLNCTVGDRVVRGDVIGYVGATGWATGSHLHYEIRINGITVDPINYLDVKLPVHIVDGSKRINVDLPEDFEETIGLIDGEKKSPGGSGGK